MLHIWNKRITNNKQYTIKLETEAFVSGIDEEEGTNSDVGVEELEVVGDGDVNEGEDKEVNGDS
jgi:hypothetical protein